jgi:F-type H+-transporting ATPase subunit b
MQRKKAIILVLFCVPLLLFMSSAEESHPSQTRDFLGKLLNFLLLFGGLAYLLRKPMGKFLQDRSDSLEQRLREAKQSHEDAVERLTRVEARLVSLDGEVQAMQREAESEGQSLHQQLQDEAKQAAERQKHFTSQEIEMLTQNAIREIKEYAATLAGDLAQKRIQERMTEEYHSSLIDKSIENLEKIS